MSSHSEDEGAGFIPQKFWGETVSAGAAFQISLERTELHITNACITKPGRAIVSVQTADAKAAVPIAALRWPEGPFNQLLDLSFFPLDGSVTIRVEGGVDVHFSGNVALTGDALLDDEDEEEADADEEQVGAMTMRQARRGGGTYTDPPFS